MEIGLRAIVTFILCAGAIAAFILLTPEEDSMPPAASSGPTEQVPRPAATETAPEPTADNAATPAPVRDFIAAYAAQDIQQLRTVTDPGLYASLTTSDLQLGTAAGTQILEVTDGSVRVGSEESGYTLSYETFEDEEGGGEQAIVTAVDFLNPPAGAALPLGGDGRTQLQQPVQQALTAVIAQPGGQSDQQRTETIQATFTAPQAAPAIPRRAGEDVSIRIGNPHQLVATEENGTLAVRATVPYAPDGSPDVQWVTVTVLLARDENGAWAPKDAHL